MGIVIASIHQSHLSKAMPNKWLQNDEPPAASRACAAGPEMATAAAAAINSRCFMEYSVVGVMTRPPQYHTGMRKHHPSCVTLQEMSDQTSTAPAPGRAND